MVLAGLGHVDHGHGVPLRVKRWTDGQAFADIDTYKQILLKDPDQLARNLAEKLLVYGTGAPIEFADRAAVEQIVAVARADDYGFRTLLHAVVQSRVFRTK